MAINQIHNITLSHTHIYIYDKSDQINTILPKQFFGQPTEISDLTPVQLPNHYLSTFIYIIVSLYIIIIAWLYIFIQQINENQYDI